LFKEGDTQQSSTDKPMALEFLIELEFRNIGFLVGRKTGEPGEKPSKQGRGPTTNSTHIIMMPGLGIEPGTHWLEASALTTAPPLPKLSNTLTV